MITVRQRKSPFIKLFDKTPPGVVCPHFYELVLSNGCIYDCAYCYLKLTFRGNTKPVLFDNPWEEVRSQLGSVPDGVFATGELADSLAVIPPLLPPALDYFAEQDSRYLLLLTKSVNIRILEQRPPSPQIIVSFSVNAPDAAARFEPKAPSPWRRLEAAQRLKGLGWRVRIRLDPIILNGSLDGYRAICDAVAELEPETVTLGTLRQYPGVFRFLPQAPRLGLRRAPDGRMRYGVEARVEAYAQMAEWLGTQPDLCKETPDVYAALGWIPDGCNCTTNGNGHRSSAPYFSGATSEEKQ